MKPRKVRLRKLQRAYYRKFPPVHLLGSRGSVERSRTYGGIGAAMAAQWVPVLRKAHSSPPGRTE